MHVVAPLLVMGVPVLLMGASFPFLQAVVARRMDTLGRRTGSLLFANICGNVAGGAITGFVLLERLGTAATLRVLAGVLLLPGLLAAARLATPRRRAAAALGAVALFALGALAVPSNERLWAFLHSAPLDRFELDEDRACVTSLVDRGDETFLYINASWQNGHPYDSFHILIGLLPTLVHPEPRRGLAVGLGIGSTAYSLAQHPSSRARRLRRDLRRREAPDRAARARAARTTSRRLVEDPRVRLIDGDGRRFLLAGGEPYDVIVVDAVRPNTAYAGNLYSIEFYEMVKQPARARGPLRAVGADRAGAEQRADGLPSRLDHGRARVLRLLVPDRERGPPQDRRGHPPHPLRGPRPRRTPSARARSSGCSAFFDQASFERQPYRRIKDLGPRAFNHDLFPRDEYFLNNEW